MMDITEDLCVEAARAVGLANADGTIKVQYQGTEIDLTPPWRRVTMHEVMLGVLHYHRRSHVRFLTCFPTHHSSWARL